MGRKKLTPAELVPDAAIDGQALQETQNVASLAVELAADRDLVNQLLGQAQMAGASEDFFRTVRTSKLAHVKEHKLYRALSGMKSPHGAETLRGTWAEFCGLLGRSVDQVDRDITNLRAFGEEALESMSRMGIGYRELRQYRRLPEDEKSALIEAAKAGDSAAFVDLAEQLISKHTKEKEELVKRVDDAEADRAAARAVAAKYGQEKDQLQVELIKLNSRIQKQAAPERSKELCTNVAKLVLDFDLSIQGSLREAFEELSKDAESASVDHRYFQSLMVHQLEKTLGAIRDEYGLPAIDEASDFGWIEGFKGGAEGGQSER